MSAQPYPGMLITVDLQLVIAPFLKTLTSESQENVDSEHDGVYWLMLNKFWVPKLACGRGMEKFHSKNIASSPM